MSGVFMFNGISYDVQREAERTIFRARKEPRRGTERVSKLASQFEIADAYSQYLRRVNAFNDSPIEAA